MAHHATGTFDVQLVPEPSDEYVGRLGISKKFKGDLEAASAGQMLSTSTEVEGSAGYVAMERVSGTLGGRHGTFVLMHSGIMSRGSQHLAITVVPDSGTGELVGLSGSLAITIADGRHSYDFEYTLDPGG
jgi:Protein of unknown function (DUF3224)